ncbi:unnamed protein product, partial [Mesorhabditis spiculigera]
MSSHPFSNSHAVKRLYAQIEGIADPVKKVELLESLKTIIHAAEQMWDNLAELPGSLARDSQCSALDLLSRTPQISMMPTAVPPSKYPSARRDEKIIDDLHGVKIADPYRWMEDPENADTKKWVDELNNVSEPFLKEAPTRENLREKLTAIWDFPKFGGISTRGGFYYTSHNTGLQNQ